MLRKFFNFLFLGDKENHVRFSTVGREVTNNKPLSYKFSELVSSSPNAENISNRESVVITKDKDSIVVRSAMGLNGNT